MAHEMALKIINKCACKRRTGRNIFWHLGKVLAYNLDRDETAVKLALLKLNAFATPGHVYLPGITVEKWLEAMRTPLSLYGVEYSEGLKIDLGTPEGRKIMDEIDALPKCGRQNHI